MSYGYGQQNPFDDRNGGGYGDDGGRSNYRSNEYGNQYGNDYGDEYGSNVEMAPLTPNAANNDPNWALHEISSIDMEIKDLKRKLDELRGLQTRSVQDSDASATNPRIDELSADIMARNRLLVSRVRTLKSNSQLQSSFGQQVKRIDTQLKDAIRQYQNYEASYRRDTQELMRRQYRIVNPGLSEQEISAAVEESGNQQIFQTAFKQSNRTGQAQQVQRAVEDRHEQLKKINQQMIELAQLFQDLDVLVMQQDENIVSIEQKGEEVVDNLDRGNQEVGVAVNTARATRKKKWWCLGICVAIIVILALILIIYFVINPPGGGNKKRSLPELSARDLIDIEATSKLLLPKFHSRINPETRRWLMSTTT
ncbi:t-SNARE [Xylariaceae sp. FL1019]|nr:t-SNARE [Xylariaceae sp. FL1019]